MKVRGVSTRRLTTVLGVLVFALAATMAANASTLSITPTFDSSITSDPNAAAIEAVINNEIALFQSTFSDPINVTIKFQEGGGLGGSSTTLYKITYQNFINALVADGKTATDATALAHLPTGANNPVTNSTSINVKTANLKALGFNGASFPPIGGFDGTITLNTLLTDVGSPGTTGQYSLASVTAHEIDEVLGLGSDLGSTNSFFNDPAPEDLFRYNSSGGRSFTAASNALAYFSVDGTTLLAQFDNQGDGGDYGDWQSNPLPNGVSPKVQDAFATPGSHPTLGVELTALDAIGYDLNAQTQVPEPASIVMFGSGLMMAAGTLRRKFRK